MFSLDKLLEYSKEHSQSVIIVLVGLIIIGGFSGGLYIQNLLNIWNENDKLSAKQIQIIEERYKKQFGDISSEYKKFKLRVAELRSTFDACQEALEAIAKRVDQIAETKELPLSDKSYILSLSKKISDQVQFISRELTTIRLPMKYFDDIYNLEMGVTNWSYRGAFGIFLIKTLSFPLLMFLILFLMLLIITRYLIRNHRKKTLLNSMNEDKDHINISYKEQYEKRMKKILEIIDYGNKKNIKKAKWLIKELHRSS